MLIDYSRFDTALKMLGKDIQEKKLNVEEILQIHDTMLSIYGGENGVRDANLLESVCVAPHQSFGGVDLYPTIFDKAAKYLVDFSRYQVFLDGNKRTGVLAMWQELILNGYNLNKDFTNEMIYGLTMDIANNRITDLEVVSKILREHSCLCLDFLDNTSDITNKVVEDRPEDTEEQVEDGEEKV